MRYIAELVTPGYYAADIGTDHGFVPVYLIKGDISPRALAVDVSEGSLLKAQELVARMGLEDRIECRLSDGFQKIEPYEVDCAIIAGMGGILMSNILESGAAVLESLKEIIVSPHRDAPLVRTVLEEHGFRIVSDEVIEDKNKKYTVIKACNTR